MNRPLPLIKYPADQALDIVIQIVNYNTADHLENAITSLIKDLADSTLKWRVIIMDNNSSDNLQPMASKYAAENTSIQFYKSSENKGFGSGHNLISKLADSKYILVLNPDATLLEPHTIERLMADFNDPKVKAVGPQVIQHQTIQWWDHGEYLFGNPGLNVQSRPSQPKYVGWISGAFTIFEKTTYQKLGGYDENIFLFKEDDDIGYRLSKLGFKMLYDPRVKIQHIGGIVSSMSKYKPPSMNYFLNKHRKDMGWLIYIFYYLLNRFFKI